MTCLHLLLTLVFAVSLGTPVEIQRPRGVPLTKKQFYEEGKPFTCLDGSRTIPFDRVNDDYCDCKDGSDEPGTAACPNGSFHCTNAGYRPMFIPSSRINDGICDCCDTTDEYNSGAKCENTCKELGRKEREVLQKMAEITKEGFLLKQQLIEEAKKGREEKQGKVTDMQENKKQLEEKVEALRTVKEAAEQPEKEAKERHLKAWEEQKAAIRLEKDKAKMAEAFLELDDNSDGFVSVSELQSHAELDPDADGTLTETEVQGLMGGAAQVDTSTFESVWTNIKDKYHSESQPEEPAPVETPPDEVKEPAVDNDSEPYPEDDISEEDDEDEDDEDDYHEDDDKAPPTVKTPEKSHEDEEAMPPYDPDTQALIEGWLCCQSYSSIRLYSSSSSLFSSANQLFSGSQLLRRPEMTLRIPRKLFGRWTIKSEILKRSCRLISALMLSSLTCTASATNFPLASTSTDSVLSTGFHRNPSMGAQRPTLGYGEVGQGLKIISTW
uniref:Protein kinase C substrate 80K-H n=1 Tax=Cyprinus carpio TaxID=7962 RepID=A0A8C2EAI7_CYPCA